MRVLDGGTGHELKLRGFGDAAFRHSFMAGLLANQKAPELVAAVHTDFLLAGADMVTTNNFVCVEHQLRREGLEGELVALTQASARCAATAVERARGLLGAGDRRGERMGVVGSLPPLQTCYFTPDLAPASMAAQYGTIARALAPSCSVLLAETLCSGAEACAAASAARATGRPVWVSFSLHDDLTATLRGGAPLETAVAPLLCACPRTFPVPAVVLPCMKQGPEAAAIGGGAAGEIANAFDLPFIRCLVSCAYCGGRAELLRDGEHRRGPSAAGKDGGRQRRDDRSVRQHFPRHDLGVAKHGDAREKPPHSPPAPR